MSRVKRRALQESLANILTNTLSHWRLHHGEVVTNDGDHLAHLRTQEFVPSIRSEISSVLQEPLHALRVVFLWWWFRVARLAADTLGCPDEQSGWGLEVMARPQLRAIGSQGLDAVLEMR